jgi:hypothetical protein
MNHTIRTHPDHPDHARRAHARARIHHHELQELHSLELAVRAADDTVARLLEARADQAHLDARAIAAEHDLDPITHDN